MYFDTNSFKMLLKSVSSIFRDAVNDLISSQDPFLRVDNPEAWLRTVAVNVARSRFRRTVVFHGLISRTGPPADVVPGLSPDHVALVYEPVVAAPPPSPATVRS